MQQPSNTYNQKEVVVKLLKETSNQHLLAPISSKSEHTSNSSSIIVKQPATLTSISATEISIKDEQAIKLNNPNNKENIQQKPVIGNVKNVSKLHELPKYDANKYSNPSHLAIKSNIASSELIKKPLHMKKVQSIEKTSNIFICHFFGKIKLIIFQIKCLFAFFKKSILRFF